MLVALLALHGAAAGGQQDRKDTSKGSSTQSKEQGQSNRSDQNKSGEKEKVCGIVAEVATAGEAVIDYDSDRAAVARTTYLTIVEDKDNPKNQGREHSSDKNKDQSGNRTESSKSSQDRADVFYIAITPQTEVCMEKDKKDQSRSSTNASHDEARSRAAFDKLELGDEVEVEYTPIHQTSSKAEQQTHGRHRAHRGIATDITILSTPRRDSSLERTSGSSSESRKSSDSNSSSKDSGKK
jgi:hypothetical protein